MVDFGNGKRIEWVYSAGGAKLRKEFINDFNFTQEEADKQITSIDMVFGFNVSDSYGTGDLYAQTDKELINKIQEFHNKTGKISYNIDDITSLTDAEQNNVFAYVAKLMEPPSNNVFKYFAKKAVSFFIDGAKKGSYNRGYYRTGIGLDIGGKVFQFFNWIKTVKSVKKNWTGVFQGYNVFTERKFKTKQDSIRYYGSDVGKFHRILENSGYLGN